MPARPRLLFAISATSLLLVVVGACTFTTGVNDLQNADCGTSQKACQDKQTGVWHCIGLDNPLYGCGNLSCGGCPLQNAQTRCDSLNKCVVATCNPGYAHCSSDPSDGCEATIYTDIDNCGLDQMSACGHKCASDIMGQATVTTPACINGVCQIGGCVNGYQDCDKVLSNGCECAAPGTCNPTTGACIFPDGGTD